MVGAGGGKAVLLGTAQQQREELRIGEQGPRFEQGQGDGQAGRAQCGAERLGGVRREPRDQRPAKRIFGVADEGGEERRDRAALPIVEAKRRGQGKIGRDRRGARARGREQPRRPVLISPA